MTDADPIACPAKSSGNDLDQQAVTLLATAIASITEAAGWRTNIGQNVLVDDDEPADKVREFVEVVDETETLIGQAPTGRRSQLTIVLYVSVQARQGVKARPRLRLVLADLRDLVRALAEDHARSRRRFPAGITSVAIGDRTVAPGQKAGWAEATLAVVFDFTDTYPPRRT